MVDKFGQVMVYVKDVEACTRFWVEQAGFVKLDGGDGTVPGSLNFPWAEVAPTAESDTSLVLFQRDKVAEMEPELDLGTPSILFSTYDIAATHAAFTERGVHANDVVTRAGVLTFSFSDNEEHWFAMQEIARPK